MNSCLEVKRLTKRFRGIAASDGLDLTVTRGELHAVIGPNGAGKSTLIGQLCGEIAPDRGTIAFDGVDITHMPINKRALLGIARSYQITSVFEELTVLENVVLAVQARSGHSFGVLGSVAQERKLLEPASEAIEAVGLLEFANHSAALLAHGARRQLELAMVLAMRPRLLLLDEPMAGTSPTESKEIVSLLKKLRGTMTIVLIEHDLQAVFELADRISVLVYGKVIASGHPDEIRSDPRVIEAYIGEEGLVS